LRCDQYSSETSSAWTLVSYLNVFNTLKNSPYADTIEKDPSLIIMPRPVLREGIYRRFQATAGNSFIEMPTNEFIKRQVHSDITDVSQDGKECQCEERD
jgi:hypothetical protein